MFSSRVNKSINQKPFLRQVYSELYSEFKNNLPEITDGKIFLELGSGRGFIKEIIPNVITSDVTKSDFLDLCFCACCMPFKDASIDRLFLLDVLHHFKDTEAFFREASRCLKEGGKIVMIEPANTAIGRFIYRRFHHENFDPCTGWSVSGKDDSSGANLAVPWIIFFRDRLIFEKKFPELKIKRINFGYTLLYIASGGLTYRQFFLPCFYPLIKIISRLLHPLESLFAILMLIEIEKRD